MTRVADFFRADPDALLDPRLREWKSLIEADGMTAVLEMNHWPGAAFGRQDPDMELHFHRADRSGPSVSLLWDDSLNSGLIRLHVRAADLSQESMRFSMSFITAFRAAECVAGDGFFNSVLFDYINASDLGENEVITALLRVISVVPVDRGAAKYARCRDMIDSAIRGRAMELKDDLGYSIDEAWEILVGALARYLDRRFSVSFRRERGLL